MKGFEKPRAFLASSCGWAGVSGLIHLRFGIFLEPGRRALDF